jgi:transposase
MSSVALKTADQQAAAMVLKHREMLLSSRTQAINALRGHATEFGVIAAKGTAQVQTLLDKLAADETIPLTAQAMFVQMGKHIDALDQQIAALDDELLALHKAHPVSQLLAEVPGIGPISAITLALTVQPEHFASGRHFAAWLGLTPKEHSTGGKPRLGKISKAGNERLRSLLVVGATSVIRHARPGKPSASAWLLALIQRKPRKLAAVALANKTARIVWAMMSRGEAYRRQPMAA